MPTIPVKKGEGRGPKFVGVPLPVKALDVDDLVYKQKFYEHAKRHEFTEPLDDPDITEEPWLYVDKLALWEANYNNFLALREHIREPRALMHELHRLAEFTSAIDVPIRVIGMVTDREVLWGQGQDIKSLMVDCHARITSEMSMEDTLKIYFSWAYCLREEKRPD